MKSLRMTTYLLLAAMLSSPSMAAEQLKFGHDNKTDPFENPQHACTGVFANIVNTDTNGEINVEVFGSNQLGSAAEHIQMVRDGVIQASLVSTGAIASYYPRIDVLNLPFAFTSNAATYDVFDGQFGKALASDIEQTLGDVIVLGFPDTGGFFAVTNSKKEIAGLEDFKGIRLRTMSLPSHKVIVQALGAEAYPLAWGEVYSGLQTGVIDGQMNPVPIISFAKFGEVQEYLTLTNHLFSPYIMILNRDFYERLTPQQQTVLHYATKSCVAASRGIAHAIEASERGIAGLRNQLKITALAPEQRDAMAAATQPAFEKHIAENLDEKASELLSLFKSEVESANSAVFMD